MMTIKDKESNQRVNKIQKGLELTFKKLLEEKRAKNSELIILRDNEIVAVKPEEYTLVLY
jgi:hypothetical protein